MKHLSSARGKWLLIVAVAIYALLYSGKSVVSVVAI